MDLTSRSARGVAILELSGRFDAHEAPAVREWLEKMEESASTKVVVNLTGVNFIDSTGMSTLVQGMKHCRQQGGDLHLCSLQKPVRIIFELMRLDRAFQIFADEEEALGAFEANA